MKTNRIIELANSIQANTSKYDNYLSSQGLPSPSFDVTTPLDLELSVEAAAARSEIIEATDELQTLILGPTQTVNALREICSPVLQAIHRFDIANSFPVEGTATFAQIAQRCGRDEDEVRRLLRMAMTYRLFREPEPGMVAHTAATKALVEKPFLNAWIGMWLEELGVSLANMTEALSKWPGSQEPNEAAFNLAFNTKKELYEELSGDPIRAIRFKDAMEYFQSAPGFEVFHAVDGFDWKNQLAPNATVVDVGGSHGLICIELARRFPELNFVVQDREEIVKSGESKLPSDVASKVKFMPYDFFAEQPVKNADVYFYRWIFHNWSDKYCKKICHALIPALKKGARLLIQELLIPEPGELSPYRERKTRWTDLGMMAMANSKERDRNDWIELLKDSDPRFALKTINTPPGSELSLIEIIWEEY